jgi:hypothetical protein
METAENVRSVGKANRGTMALDIPDIGSFPKVQDARAKARVAGAALRDWEAKRKDIFLERRKSISVARAAKLELDMAALEEEGEVLGPAAYIANKALDEAVVEASVGVCRRFASQYQALFKEMLVHAAALQEVLEAEESFRLAIRAKGFKLTAPIAEYPALQVRVGRATDSSSPLGCFLRALRAKGVEL